MSYEQPQLNILDDMSRYRFAVRESDESHVNQETRSFALNLYRDWPYVAREVVYIAFNDPDYIFFGDLKQVLVKVARDRARVDTPNLSHFKRWLMVSMAWNQSKFQIIWDDRPRRYAQFRGEREFCNMLKEELDYYACASGTNRPNTWESSERRYLADMQHQASRLNCE